MDLPPSGRRCSNSGGIKGAGNLVLNSSRIAALESRLSSSCMEERVANMQDKKDSVKQAARNLPTPNRLPAPRPAGQPFNEAAPSGLRNIGKKKRQPTTPNRECASVPAPVDAASEVRPTGNRRGSAAETMLALRASKVSKSGQQGTHSADGPSDLATGAAADRPDQSMSSRLKRMGSGKLCGSGKNLLRSSASEGGPATVRRRSSAAETMRTLKSQRNAEGRCSTHSSMAEESVTEDICGPQVNLDA